jgi:hypothetical protein
MEKGSGRPARNPTAIDNKSDVYRPGIAMRDEDHTWDADFVQMH